MLQTIAVARPKWSCDFYIGLTNIYSVKFKFNKVSWFFFYKISLCFVYFRIAWKLCLSRLSRCRFCIISMLSVFFLFDDLLQSSLQHFSSESDKTGASSASPLNYNVAILTLEILQRWKTVFLREKQPENWDVKRRDWVQNIPTIFTENDQMTSPHWRGFLWWLL